MTTTVMKLGTMVICGEALQTIPVWMTFIQGHGHHGWLKILKNSNIDINFLSRYDPYSHETLHKGTLWLGLSCHASFFDLHPRSQLQELMEDVEKHWIFLIHYHHCSNLSWQDGIPSQDVSEHTSLGDLYPKTRSQGNMETLGNTITGRYRHYDNYIPSECTSLTFSQGQGR